MASYPRTEQMNVDSNNQRENNQRANNNQEKDWSYRLGDCHDACFLCNENNFLSSFPIYKM
jgi:hypothetical protein